MSEPHKHHQRHHHHASETKDAPDNELPIPPEPPIEKPVQTGNQQPERWDPPKQQYGDWAGD